jgi:hypothetical protein
MSEIVVEAQHPAPPRPMTTPAEWPATDLATTNTHFDAARDNLSPRFRASTFDLNRAFIETLPQGTDGSINKVSLTAKQAALSARAAAAWFWTWLGPRRGE